MRILSPMSDEDLDYEYDRRGGYRIEHTIDRPLNSYAEVSGSLVENRNIEQDGRYYVSGSIRVY